MLGWALGGLGLAGPPVLAQVPSHSLGDGGQVPASPRPEVTLEQALPNPPENAVDSPAVASSCPSAVLDRPQLHRVSAGETLAAIAQRYSLTPLTLKGFNPAVRDLPPLPGQQLWIPPYNGVRVETLGQSWGEIAQRYGVAAEVLFELNGCTAPETLAFVPGLHWRPGIETSQVSAPGTSPLSPARQAVLGGYPLAQVATSLVSYGWQISATLDEALFHGGVDLAAELGDAVLAVGAGTVAFAGEQGDYGQLVVINHAQGLQTRYAHLGAIAVELGQIVAENEPLGRVGQTGVPTVSNPHLHFEVRLNSRLGWVAQDPSAYLSAAGAAVVGQR